MENTAKAVAEGPDDDNLLCAVSAAPDWMSGTSSENCPSYDQMIARAGEGRLPQHACP